MTAVRWLEGPVAPPSLDRPAAWLLREGDPEWESLAQTVRPAAADQADAALFSSEARAAGRLRRRLLLRALAGLSLGVAPGEVEIVRDRAGAVCVTEPQRLYASLAAREGWTLFGLSRTAVGVDVESTAMPEPLPLDTLAPEEAAIIADACAFSRVWAVKEAVLKMLGVGLNRDPATLLTRFDGMQATTFDAASGIRLAVAESRWCGPGVAAVATPGSSSPA